MPGIDKSPNQGGLGRGRGILRYAPGQNEHEPQGVPTDLSQNTPETFVPPTNMSAAGSTNLPRPPNETTLENLRNDMYLCCKTCNEAPKTCEPGQEPNVLVGPAGDAGVITLDEGETLAPEEVHLTEEFLVSVDTLTALQYYLYRITWHPDELATLLPLMTGRLNADISQDNEALFQQTVDLIFLHIVETKNFAYSGAQVASYLTSNLSLQFVSGGFKEYLIKRCEQEHALRNERSQSTSGLVRLRGLALFLGEMFTSLEDDSADKKSLMAMIYDLLHLLIHSGTPDNLKCSGQLLKLTGYCLESFERRLNLDQHTAQMDAVISSIENVIASLSGDSPDIRSASDLMKKVLDLRANNWEQGISVQGQPGSGQDNGSCIPLSAQNGCISSIELATGPIDDYDESSIELLDSEMDPEMQAAFEQFLVESNQC